MASPVKLLFAGDPNGAHAALVKRVGGVNSKNGPFSALLCVGSFFTASGGDEGDVPADLQPFLEGTAQPPVPMHFIGGWGQGSNATLTALQDATAATGLSYLGRAGVTTIQGLNVAFLDGTYSQQSWSSDPATQGSSCRHYTEADVALLKRQLQTADGEIDVLLTCEWPSGIMDGLPSAQAALPGYDARRGSHVIAEIAQLARPRYHIAGGQGLFYTRPPYINKDLGAGIRATRFVGLGAVNNSSKQKFLHALALQPSSDMTPEALSQQPDGSTPSPYELNQGRAGKRRAGDAEDLPDGSDWRWQGSNKRPRQEQSPATPWGNPNIPQAPSRTVYIKNLAFPATLHDVEQFFAPVGKVIDVRRGVNDRGYLNGWAHVQLESEQAVQEAVQLNGQVLLGRELHVEAARPGGAREQRHADQVVANCWFCLSSPEVDINLVASVGEECYVALDKGPITPQHVLIVPIEHFPSSMAVPEGCYEEMQRYLSALKACFAAQGQQLVAFERHLALRGRGGNHCHFNAIAVSPAVGATAREVFEAKAGFPFTYMQAVDGQVDRSAILEVVGQGEFFMAMLPDGSVLLRALTPADRCMTLGREVLAELTGVPQRADWKQCKATPEEETANTEAFKEAFKDYDIMQQ